MNRDDDYDEQREEAIWLRHAARQVCGECGDIGGHASNCPAAPDEDEEDE